MSFKHRSGVPASEAGESHQRALQVHRARRRKEEARRRARNANNPEFRARQNAHNAKWEEANPEVVKAKRKRTYVERYEKTKGTVEEWTRRALWNSKIRATKTGLPFAITAADLAVPALCPILHTPLVVGVGKPTAASPSVDRVDNTKGYIPGNVRVISARANKIKNDANLAELRAIVRYMEEHVCTPV